MKQIAVFYNGKKRKVAWLNTQTTQRCQQTTVSHDK